ncbi:MAG TPA: DNA adenine methylase [Clostridium sp.]
MTKYSRGIPRIGGKKALLPVLLPILEYTAKQKKLNLFIDGCTGGMKVVANIDVTLFSEGLIANDLEPGIANLAKVFGDSTQVKRLYVKIENLLKDIDSNKVNALDFFNEANKFIKKDAKKRKDNLPTSPDKFLSAFLTFFITYSHTYSNANCFYQHALKKNLFDYKAHEKCLSYVDTFRKITVRNESFLDLIDEYGCREDILFYIDPPYVLEAMTSGEQYLFGLEDKLQQEMVDKLTSQNFKARVFISGWENKIYKKLERGGFNKYYVANTHVATANSSGKIGRKEAEMLWSNVMVPTRLLPDASELRAALAKNEEDIRNQNEVDLASYEDEILRANTAKARAGERLAKAEARIATKFANQSVASSELLKETLIAMNSKAVLEKEVGIAIKQEVGAAILDIVKYNQAIAKLELEKEKKLKISNSDANLMKLRQENRLKGKK